jgi:type II secretory pathway pseudopilin PulG
MDSQPDNRYDSNEQGGVTVAILSMFIFILSIFGISTLSTFGSTQAKARDIERKNDINSIYQKLEEHYNENGEYPTEKELLEEYDTQLPGIDQNALLDPNGKFIQSGDYTYTPTECTAVGCKKYTLSSTLEGDATLYTKTSLN